MWPSRAGTPLREASGSMVKSFLKEAESGQMSLSADISIHFSDQFDAGSGAPQGGGEGSADILDMTMDSFNIILSQFF